MARISQKQLLIDQTNKRVIIITSVAAFIVIFCLVAAQALFSQLLYQNKIVSHKKEALAQLVKNKQAVGQLDNAYATFTGSAQNVLGGLSNGGGPQDGDNAKIVLDALPSKYDFPALATSLEKLLTSQNIEIDSISGTDDELAQSATKASGTPQAIPIPFEIGAGGDYQSIQNLTKTFEASIRPIQLQTLTLTGDSTKVTVNATAQTYYQPEKTFSVGTQVVK